MSRFQYNDYNGPETVQTEYKLFTFHPKGTLLDPNDETYAENLLRSGDWIFNQQVINNLEFYLDTYIPKYTTAFLSHDSETENGEMYFGVSDDGFIQGVPYQGELDIESIRSKVNSILDSDLIQSDHNLKDYVQIELIKIDTSDFVLSLEHQKTIEDYFSQKKIYDEKLGKYLEKKKKWCQRMDYYSDRLHSLLNNPESRSAFLQYVLIKAPDNKELHSLLLSPYQFTAKTGEEISILKENKDGIWYWITRWKDEMSDFVKTMKPQPPPGLGNRVYAHNIITTIVDMIPHWLNNNSNNINLYLLKFSFQKPDVDLDIKYRGPLGDYIYCYRRMIDSGPLCQPY